MSGRPMALTAATLLILAGCSADDDPEPTPVPTTQTPSPGPPETPDSPTTTASGPVVPSEVDEIATGLDAPWSIAFTANGEALVSLRDAGVIVRVDTTGEVTEVGEVPGVDGDTEGGLLGIAVDPSSPSTLYAYATTGAENRVLRTTYDGEGFGEFETVIDGIPAASRHNGGRLLFGPDGMLYVSTGDAGNDANAQDLTSLGGKILRFTPDGEIPADNPFDDSPVYSYGHRNVQGLAFDDSGQLWASEFGDDLADELNRMEPGGNYGWPTVEGIAGDHRFVDPVVDWPPPDASPSALAYVRGTFFLAALRGERLWQVPAPGGAVGDPAVFLDDYGRLRDVVVAPDGSLWVLTNNTDGRTDPRPGDDRILRVTLSPTS